MGQLNHPSPRFKGRIFLNQFLLLPPWPDVGDETVRFHRFLLPYVRRVKAEVLFDVLFFGRDHPCFQQRVKRHAVMPIGSADDERQGDATLVD